MPHCWRAGRAGGCAHHLSAAKPKIPVGDRPIMDVIARQLRRAGFALIYVATGYLAELTDVFFGDGSTYGIPIDYFQKDEPLQRRSPGASGTSLTQTQLAASPVGELAGPPVDIEAIVRHGYIPPATVVPRVLPQQTKAARAQAQLAGGLPCSAYATPTQYHRLGDAPGTADK
jgi:hypothetical protein